MHHHDPVDVPTDRQIPNTVASTQSMRLGAIRSTGLTKDVNCNTSTHMHACLTTYIHVHKYTHTYIHTHTHTHTYTQMRPPQGTCIVPVPKSSVCRASFCTMARGRRLLAHIHAWGPSSKGVSLGSNCGDEKRRDDAANCQRRELRSTVWSIHTDE